MLIATFINNVIQETLSISSTMLFERSLLYMKIYDYMITVLSKRLFPSPLHHHTRDPYYAWKHMNHDCMLVMLSKRLFYSIDNIIQETLSSPQRHHLAIPVMHNYMKIHES